jgi:D-lactate dehydrogenase
MTTLTKHTRSRNEHIAMESLTYNVLTGDPSRAVAFYEVFAEERDALQRYLPPDLPVTMTAQSIQENGDLVVPAPVICIRTQSVIPAAWGQQLRGVLSRSAGYDHLTRFRELTGSRVACGHLFRYSGRAVAEQAALLWMALLRHLPAQTTAMQRFVRDNLTGCECHGRTLVVVGVGDIGHHVAVIGAGLGMHVIGVDPVVRHPGINYLPPDQALPRADIIVCAMNLTGTNAGYFSPRRLATLKPGALFINVSRGEFARHTDLLAALEAGTLGGVGLDVYYDEPRLGPALRDGRPSEHPEDRAFYTLRERSDVLMTPHNAFNTVEAVDRKSEQTVRQLIHFLTHGSFIDHTRE